ncbi:MAG: TetR/AcrR family transcriptional regulator [Sphaerochaeta sp.]
MFIENYKEANISRSECWIINALLKLLKEFPFDVLTITEICQEADVSRVTFYRYFDNKEAILLKYIKILGTDYLAKLQENENITYELVIHSYFSYWLKEKEFLIILKNNNLENLILEEHSIIEKHLNSIENLNPNFTQNSYSNLEILYVRAYTFSGLWRILFLWLSRDFNESVDIMTEILLKIDKLYTLG